MYHYHLRDWLYQRYIDLATSTSLLHQQLHQQQHFAIKLTKYRKDHGSHLIRSGKNLEPKNTPKQKQ